MNIVKFIKFNVIGDHRGSLISLEKNNEIPFDIKRIYYIFDTKVGVSRGFHSHKDLEQIVVCVKGSCRIVIDDGTKRESVILDRPDNGIYIDSNKWREMHDFSEDCVLLVIASKCYDEEDYIRDYNKFREHISSR